MLVEPPSGPAPHARGARHHGVVPDAATLVHFHLFQESGCVRLRREGAIGRDPGPVRTPVARLPAARGQLAQRPEPPLRRHRRPSRRGRSSDLRSIRTSAFRADLHGPTRVPGRSDTLGVRPRSVDRDMPGTAVRLGVDPTPVQHRQLPRNPLPVAVLVRTGSRSVAACCLVLCRVRPSGSAEANRDMTVTVR